MIPILEFQERSLKGPVMKRDEFDLALVKRVRQLVAKYGIKYDPAELLPDDKTADAVFQAGVEMLADVGLYNSDTQRVIKYRREEIEQIAREYRENPPKRTFGQGNDEHTIEYRTGEDSRPPVLWALAARVIQEEWFIPFIQSIAQEETVKGFGVAGGIASVGGIVPKAGTVTEIHCGLWEQQALAEALRRAGRPGMHLGVLTTVSSVGGAMACLGTGLRGPHNTQIGIHIMPEQKLNWDRLMLAYICDEQGIEPWISAMSVVGGLVGGPAGGAVGLVANLLGQLSYGHGKIGSLNAADLEGRIDTLGCIWAYGASARAVEQNIRVPLGGSPAPTYDVGSEASVLRGAALTIAMTASGMAYCWGGGRTALEARLFGEVIKGVAGMRREQANELVKAIMAMADEQFGPGIPRDNYFPHLYDPKTLRPKPAFLADCNRAAEKLVRIGVPISNRFVID